MESENRADLERIGNDMLKDQEVDGSGTGMRKDEENINNQAIIITSQSDVVTEHSQTVQNQNPSELENEASRVVPGSRSAKKSGMKATTGSKKDQAQKSETGRNGVARIQQKRRPGVSQNFCFPAKGAPTSGLRKNTNGIKLAKNGTRTSHSNGGSVVESSISNAGTPAKPSRLTSSMSGSRKTMVVNSSSLDAVDDDSVTLRTHNANIPKTDEDAQSTTLGTTPKASTQQKSSAPVFASRLDERAEKRKKFFQKIEEKIHAKEMEKTDLQAKSKENQEAEIKKLRKSLTFKAAPMPNFYKEPDPPKAELKKIPITRPVSPKLGRRKSSVTVPDAPQGSVPSGNQQQDLDPSKCNGNIGNIFEGSVDQKKPVRKSVSKLPSQKSTTSKLVRTVPALSAKVSDLEEKESRVKLEIEDDSGEHMDEYPTEIEGSNRSCLKNASEIGQSDLVSLAPVVVGEEVSVGG